MTGVDRIAWDAARDRERRLGRPFDDEDEAVCRGCGCTDSSACPGGCSWVEDPAGIGDLCSSCLIRIWNDEPLPPTPAAR